MKDTREHILKVSFNLFLHKSFKDVTMKEIVEKSGVSKGAFYHYFTSKEELFLEIIEFYFSSFLTIDYASFNKGSLKGFYHDYLRMVGMEIQKLATEFRIDTELSTMNFYLMLFNAVSLFPNFRTKVIEVTSRELRCWEEVVRQARANGEIETSMTDEQVAKIFVRISDGVGLHMIMYGKVDVLGDELLAVWDELYNSIKKK